MLISSFQSILKIELLLRIRRSQEWLYPLGFFLIVICLFPLAFSPDPLFLQTYLPGCLWIAALLSSLLSMESMFAADMEDQHLEQLLLGQTPLTLVIAAKLCAQWLITELPLILLTPIIGLLFHLSLYDVGLLCLSLLAGTPLLTCIGSLGAALTLGLRQQGTLLGLLLLPLVIPVLIFGVGISHHAGLSIAGPLALLTGFSIFAITLLPWAIAFTLRVSLDE